MSRTPEPTTGGPTVSRTPEMSVIICSRNGGDGIGRALETIAAQTVASRLEVVVVDDGSTDETAAIADAHGARVIRHATNRGLAAARNSGVRGSTAPIVAFIDDDCEAHPQWAERLLDAHGEGVDGVGGSVTPGPGDDFTRAYLRRHNPLEPLEIELARSAALSYRLRLYLTRQWVRRRLPQQREIFSPVGASMSFRRDAIEQAGLFDEHFAFGAEETELCHRMRMQRPDVRFVLDARARVVHHFRPSMRDTLRRSRSYGRGTARFSRRWPSVNPTIYPAPVVVAALAVAAVRRPRLAPLALVAPAVLFPSGLASALRAGRPSLVIDAYVQLLQELCANVGVVEGLWQHRDLEPASDAPVAGARAPAEGVGV